MTPVWNTPCAIAGLISYRYLGPYGYIMIGAEDDTDALKEANRSLTRGMATLDKLEVWKDEKYISVLLVSELTAA